MSDFIVEKLTKSVGDKTVFKEISFIIHDLDRIGIIGVNGTGKTTLLDVVSERIGFDGDVSPFTKANGYKIAYLTQEPEFDDSKTVLDTVLSSDLREMALIREYETLMADYSEENQARLEKVMAEMDSLDAWSIESEVKTVLSKLGLSDLSQKVGDLSGGLRRRVQLAQVLLNDADLLLLDEPTNHLDIDTIAWLTNFLKSSKKTVLCITHDRYFLDDVVDRIFAFEGNGKLTQYEGGYTDYAEAKARKYGAGSSEIGAGAGSSLSDKAASGNNSTEDEEKKPTRKDWKQGQKSEKLKFTYKEEREYAVIDEDIARLEEKIARLENDMMANATNSVKLREIMADKEAAEKQLEEKMDRWVYLNDLAEQIEAQKNNG